MGKRGPAKGHGGRPRKPGGSKLKTGPNKGYTKVSVGPKGKGKQKYLHRLKAGVTKAGSKTGGTVVHHKNGRKGDSSAGNLEATTRREHGKKHGRG